MKRISDVFHTKQTDQTNICNDPRRVAFGCEWYECSSSTFTALSDHNRGQILGGIETQQNKAEETSTCWLVITLTN